MSQLHYFKGNSIVSPSMDTFICILDGRQITLLQDFYNEIAKGLKLPDYFGQNLDALDEMLYDLDWIEERNILVLVLHGSEFLSEDIMARDEILNLFQQIDNPYLEFIFIP